MSARKQIVLLGLLTNMPVAGAAWQTLQYLIGLDRLGYEVYYVEAHRLTPKKFMDRPEDDGAARAAAFLAQLMRRFGLSDRWAYCSAYGGERHFGLSEQCLRRLYRDAWLIVNLHGGTDPLPDHTRTGRLVYLETDPVRLALGLYRGDKDVNRIAAAHRAFSSYGLNYGSPDCRLPLPEGIVFHRAPPPILLDVWRGNGNGEGRLFTTVGSWRQWGAVDFEGESYTWSKDAEFLRFLDLPARTDRCFELALANCTGHDRRLLQDNGWKVRPAHEVSGDLDVYRRYIGRSRGEFTVAKDQNVRLRTGWFSERSAAYLAAGKPVITQDTGFGSYLPTGEGLFAFATMEDILVALDEVNSNYARHSRAAQEIAHEYLDANVVLRSLIAHYGLAIGGAPAARLSRSGDRR